jgi:hypothetical protein
MTSMSYDAVTVFAILLIALAMSVWERWRYDVIFTTLGPRPRRSDCETQR